MSARSKRAAAAQEPLSPFEAEMLAAEKAEAAEAAIEARAVAVGALRWKTPQERSAALKAWRDGCQRKLSGCRALKVAWVLYDLFGKKGYAYPSNGYLEGRTGLTERNVQKALAELEDAGAIVRILDGARTKDRRIYPSCGISVTRPKRTCRDTSKSDTSVSDTHTSYFSHTRARGMPQLQAARLQADRNAERERFRSEAPTADSPQPESFDPLAGETAAPLTEEARLAAERIRRRLFEADTVDGLDAVWEAEIEPFLLDYVEIGVGNLRSLTGPLRRLCAELRHALAERAVQ